MRLDRGRGELGPVQLAAQYLSFNLEVENHRHAIRLVEFMDLHQAIEQVLSVGEHFSGVLADQRTSMHARKRYPGGTVDRLMPESFENSFLAVHTISLNHKR